jgi:peptide/nickel transport system substrate-binding protein
VAEQMVADLNSIGYKASTQLLSIGAQYPFIQNSANSGKWNVAYSQWFQDYPAPSDFLNVLLGCGTIHANSDASPNIAAFCNQGINSKITQAESDEATNPAQAASLWTAVDHEDTLQGAWVDLFNPKQIDFLSKNVNGYEWNPQWYILIDQLWLSK